MILTELETDAIGESFNIAMGKAASSLSEMLNQEVFLTVPEVSIVNTKTAVKEIEASSNSNNISGVKEHFSGAFTGDALLFFSETKSLELVRMLLKQDDMDLEFLSEMEEEALTEIGNVILNACLSTIADILEEEIINEIPIPVKGGMLSIIGNASSSNYILKLSMKFSVKSVDIEGFIAFMMDVAGFDQFRTKICKYFDIPSEQPNA